MASRVKPPPTHGGYTKQQNRPGVTAAWTALVALAVAAAWIAVTARAGEKRTAQAAIAAPSNPERAASTWRPSPARAVPEPNSAPAAPKLVVQQQEPPDSRNDAKEPGPESAEEVAAKLEDRFQTDAKPTIQSRQTESALRGVLSGAAGVSLETLECRGSTCRAEVTFASEEVDAQFTRKTFADPGTRIELNLGVVIPLRVTRPNGAVAATMYFMNPEPTRGG